jgi:putative transposase
MVVPQPNAIWAVDFMTDTLYGGWRFRTLNVLEEGVREGLAVEIDTSLPAERVIRVLGQVVSWRRQPQAIRLDNGPNLSPSRSPPGVRSGRFSCGTSSRASRIRMP